MPEPPAENLAESLLSASSHNPDVLSCLANLSNDEVFTPPNVANAMLDMLPQELFKDPSTKFLDPVCKSGVFLREITKRLMHGLEKEFPDKQERLDHILHNQVFGIAITELTSLLSRRTLYCAKYATSPYSISKFANIDGNIRFKAIQHTWKNGKCIFCGASQSQYEREDGMESHAYEFIHTNKPQEIFGDMKFDVIIGNPPYQLSDGGAQASASPLYHYFIIQAQKLNPRYLSMIIPARWFAGGKGLNAFRDIMLGDIHIKELHDYPITSECFPGVNIRGGICYFLWSKDYNNINNKTKVVVHGKNNKEYLRNLKYKNSNIYIRYNEAIPILDKITKNKSLMSHVSSRKPFGLPTDFYKTNKFKHRKENKNDIQCIAKAMELGFINNNDITINRDWIEKWKVFVPRANNIGTELNDDNQNAFIGKPNQVCTESYMVIGADLNLDEYKCNNLVTYLKTKFARFCHGVAKSSQDATAKTYCYVPLPDLSKVWTDRELYAEYNLTQDEIDFIESMIKPMDMSPEADAEAENA